jgi:hypothetical protein
MSGQFLACPGPSSPAGGLLQPRIQNFSEREALAVGIPEMAIAAVVENHAGVAASGRSMVLMVARRKAGMANEALAQWLGGKHVSTVTQAVKRLEARMKEDRKLMKISRQVMIGMSRCQDVTRMALN